MAESRKNILEMYADLRLADVRDGMDWVGLHSHGSVDQGIRPMTEGMVATGIARTVRMRPTQIQVPQMTPEEYTKWAYDFWYGKVSPGAFANDIEDGDMMIVQSAEIPDVGELGSNNTLEWFAKGARGIVTSGGVRDRDECRMQNVPMAFLLFLSSMQLMLQNMPVKSWSMTKRVDAAFTKKWEEH